MSVFWDVEPICLEEIDRRFRGAYCLHHQADAFIAQRMEAKSHLKRRSVSTRPHVATSQKTVIFLHLSSVYKLVKNVSWMLQGTRAIWRSMRGWKNNININIHLK
jgi:hypothetical protein